MRRNRAPVADHATFALVLGGATAFSLRQARRADAAADDARDGFDAVRRLAGSLLFEVDDQIRELDGAQHARELIGKRARGSLDDRSGRDADEPALARELATAYTKIGDIQGGGFAPSLGQFDDGAASYTKAQATVDALPADDPETRWVDARVHFGKGRARGCDARHRARVDLARGRSALVASLPPELAARSRGRRARLRLPVASLRPRRRRLHRRAGERGRAARVRRAVGER